MNMMTGAPSSGDRLLNLQEVKEIVHLGKTRIYALTRAGNFPEPFKPGGTSTRWSEMEVREWVKAQRPAR